MIKLNITSNLDQMANDFVMMKIDLQQAMVTASDKVKTSFLDRISSQYEYAVKNPQVDIYPIDNSIDIQISGIEEDILSYRYETTMEELVDELTSEFFDALDSEIRGMF